jgi:hypothetical protein
MGRFHPGETLILTGSGAPPPHRPLRLPQRLCHQAHMRGAQLPVPVKVQQPGHCCGPGRETDAGPTSGSPPGLPGMTVPSHERRTARLAAWLPGSQAFGIQLSGIGKRLTVTITIRYSRAAIFRLRVSGRGLSVGNSVCCPPGQRLSPLRMAPRAERRPRAAFFLPASAFVGPGRASGAQCSPPPGQLAEHAFCRAFAYGCVARCAVRRES